MDPGEERPESMEGGEGGLPREEDEQYFDDNEIGHLPADHVSDGLWLASWC